MKKYILILIVLLSCLTGYSQTPIIVTPTGKLVGNWLYLGISKDSLWRLKINPAGDSITLNNRKVSLGGSTIDTTHFLHSSDLSWTKSGNNIYSNNIGNIGIGTTNPDTKFDILGSVSMKPITVDSADIAGGITNLNSVIIYNDTRDVWINWTSAINGSQIATGQEGQIVNIKSIGTGKLYLKNNTVYGDTHPSFVMSLGDNITMQYNSGYWSEVTRTDVDTTYSGISNTGIYDLYGISFTSSSMELGKYYPIGYSSCRGIVIDTITAISLINPTSLPPAPSFVISLRYGLDVTTAVEILDPVEYTISSYNDIQKIYSFRNSAIPPGYMMWLEFISLGALPENFMLQLIGHRL